MLQQGPLDEGGLGQHQLDGVVAVQVFLVGSRQGAEGGAASIK